jgi:hypothetical protein
MKSREALESLRGFSIGLMPALSQTTLRQEGKFLLRPSLRGGGWGAETREVDHE